MPIRAALDDDLVSGRRAHDGRAVPGFLTVQLIALRRGVLPQIDVAFEGFQLGIRH